MITIKAIESNVEVTIPGPGHRMAEVLQTSVCREHPRGSDPNPVIVQFWRGKDETPFLTIVGTDIIQLAEQVHRVAGIGSQGSDR